MSRYSQLLRDPRWQRRRLEIMARANFACEECGDTRTTLNVHHKVYRAGAMPWEYVDAELACLCENCHEEEHNPMPAVFASRLEELLHLAERRGITRQQKTELTTLLGRRGQS